MAITKEKLESRLTEAKQTLEQLKQQFAATSGAIADMEFWLAEWDKPDKDAVDQTVSAV